jgi:hypothetical protein
MPLAPEGGLVGTRRARGEQPGKPGKPGEARTSGEDRENRRAGGRIGGRIGDRLNCAMFSAKVVGRARIARFSLSPFPR